MARFWVVQLEQMHAVVVANCWRGVRLERVEDADGIGLGASLAELMTRMGHSSTRAARVYLHAREERDRQLADVLDRMARRELKRSGTARNVSRSGTYRARGRSSGPERGTDDHG